MKKTYILFFISIILFSCFEVSDDNIVFASNINDFVWKGMNASYLYKQNIEDLANNRFSSSEEYTDFLNLFENPEILGSPGCAMHKSTALRCATEFWIHVPCRVNHIIFSHLVNMFVSSAYKHSLALFLIK